jgi:hypothetical protein
MVGPMLPSADIWTVMIALPIRLVSSCRQFLLAHQDLAAGATALGLGISEVAESSDGGRVAQ